MSLQLRSLVRPEGELELSLGDVPVPTPGPNEVVVRVDAAPVNPSDVGVLLAGAELKETQVANGVLKTKVTLGPILKPRLGKPLPVGNEGAGVVIAAGESPAAQALLGKSVGFFGGGSYAQHRCLPAENCLPLPEGVSVVEGASNFVNPMTVLAMVETMRQEGHTALVHTAAASNLGQMLLKVCSADGVPIVCIVRKPEQVEFLKAQGAKYVCDSSAPDFLDSLTAAISATGATIGFDAIGGGKVASQILACMELAISANATEFSPYGSFTHKQVYLYGMLDRGPTVIERTFGLAWGVGGWLVSPRLKKFGPEVTKRLRQRVARELKTTFASHYTAEISLKDLLNPEVLKRCARAATGEKFLVRPQG